MRSARGLKLRFGQRDPWTVRAINKQTGLPEGEPVTAFQEGPSIRLVRVFDSRFGDYCDPPKEHFERPLHSSGFIPTDVGTFALTYLKSLVIEAEALVAESAPSKDIAV